MKIKKTLKWIKTFERYMNLNKHEYYLHYSPDFNLSVDQIIELIQSVRGVSSASFEQHKHVPSKSVIVYAIEPDFNEGVVFTEVFNLLENALKGHHIVVKEKMW
jgi:hypothetical protein